MSKHRSKRFKKLIYLILTLGLTYVVLFVFLPSFLVATFSFGGKDLGDFSCDKDTGNIISDSWCELREVYVDYILSGDVLSIRNITDRIDQNISQMSGDVSQVKTDARDTFSSSGKHQVRYELNSQNTFIPKKIPE